MRPSLTPCSVSQAGLDRCVGSRGVGGLDASWRLVGPQQQHFAVAVELRERPRLDQRERVGRIALDLRHASRPDSRPERCRRVRRHEQVADFDVRLDRHVRQVELAEIAGADRDGADAVAIHLHRHGVLGVADQDQRARCTCRPAPPGRRCRTHRAPAARLNTPSSAPLLMRTACRNGSTVDVTISAISVRSRCPCEASRIARSRDSPR